MSAPSQSRRRPRLSLLVGVALILAGIAVAVYWNFDEITFGVGLLPQGNPYESRLDRSTAARPLPLGRRLVIARLGIDVPISDRQDTGLATGVWRHSGSARPAEQGNMVLAGHRRRDVFSLLHHVRKGDIAVVYWDGEEYDYRIDHQSVMYPRDSRPLVRDGSDRLTMYTCLPRFLGNKRTVVVAYPIRSEEPSGAAGGEAPLEE